MSSVRMCDKCGSVFSELEEGWQTFTGTTFKTDEEGRRIEVRAAMDTCPSCAIQPPRQYERELAAHREGDKIEERIAKLERDTGIAGAEPTRGKPVGANG